MNSHSLPWNFALLVIGGCLLSSSLARAQSPTTDWEKAARSKMSFEVASVKLNRSGYGGMSSSFGALSVGPHFSATNVTLRRLIVMAYEVKPFQVSNAPDWTSSHRYDINADIEASRFEHLHSLPRDQQVHQLALMLEELLIDRFQLEVTRETKNLSVYALVLAKDDSKLKTLQVEPYSLVKDGNVGAGSPAAGEENVSANRATLPVFANGLSMMLGAPVHDETGMKGTYSFTIRWTDSSQLPQTAVIDPAFDHSLAEALDEVAGLKLELSKGPVDTITIDHIEEPTPN